METLVPAAIEEYCTVHSSPPAPLLEELQTYTNRNLANAQMVIGPLEAAFLQLLVRATGARRILEIGTFTGYSALAMAEALPADGEIVTCEIDPKHAEIARRFFARSPHGKKIVLHLGPALHTLGELTDALPLDFVFLDADKENYINYYERVLPRLKTGGLIVADNVLWSGRVLDFKKASDDVQGRTSVAGDTMSEATHAIMRFNELVRRDPRVERVMIPLRDGVSLIRKR
jgi:caffeoyl-CoA O-methyltransferase